MFEELIRQLEIAVSGLAELKVWSDRYHRERELALLEALPDGGVDLISYLRENPDRGDAMGKKIINTCREIVDRLELVNSRSEIPRLQGLLQALVDIQSLNLPNLVTGLPEEAEIDEAMIQSANELFIDQELNVLYNERMQRTGQRLTPAEESALDEIAFLWVIDKGKFQKLKRDTAINVVIWKMLIAWLKAMTPDNPRASETDLFGANQLQLLKGSSGKVLGRSAIEQLITHAANRYSGAPLDTLKTVREQTIVEELFPTAPTPLFWFQGRPYGERRKERQSRKIPRKNLKASEVKVWHCDSCTNSFAPGYSDATLIPWAFRSDKRNGARQVVILRDRLPTHAYPESRFMCTCWEQRAGVLCPTFDQL